MFYSFIVVKRIRNNSNWAKRKHTILYYYNAKRAYIRQKSSDQDKGFNVQLS